MAAAPTKSEINAAVGDSEFALLDFTSAFVDGSLGDMDASAASALTDAASRSVHVAANAFGVNASPDETPDSLRRKMDAVYADAWEANRVADARRSAEDREAARSAHIRSSMESVLGLSQEDVDRIRFDEENGDMSARMAAIEKYVFG